MSGVSDDADDGAATPLTPDERRALIPTHITLRWELNEFEQIGVARADRWAFARKRDVLSEDFLFALHRRMFRDVWRWAGQPRQSERNIGVDHWLIGPELRTLLDDARYWIEHQSFAPDEIAVRFHHRLVFIHPFPNGNGRWSRLAADRLVVQLGGDRFTWGRGDLLAIDVLRARYVAALRAADTHDIGPLIRFARS
jgi:Fic-DOC domain mobile mystery protein B